MPLRPVRAGLALLSLIGLALAALIALYLYRSVIATEIKVPDVSGKDLIEATTELKRAGFTVEPTGEAGPDTMAGKVSRTLPGPGSLVKPGRHLLVYYYRSEAVVVPDLVGVPLTDAINLLGRAGLSSGIGGLVLGKLTPVESDTLAGVIFEQNPAAGTELKPGDAVDLVVAVEKGGAEMPDIVNMPLEKAEQTLNSMGYVLERDRIEKYYTSQVPPGVVVSQNPSAGTRLTSESLITVRVSESPDAGANGASAGNAYPVPGGEPSISGDPARVSGPGAPAVATEPGPSVKRGTWSGEQGETRTLRSR